MWRPRRNQAYEYVTFGAWVPQERGLGLAHGGRRLLCAAGVAEECSWRAVQVDIGIRTELEGMASTAVATSCMTAWVHSDTTRRLTNNKIWRAQWTAHCGDVIARLRNSGGHATSCSDNIMQLFVTEFESPKPIPRGVAFTEKIPRRVLTRKESFD